jgi:phage minor structural protein
VVVVICIYDRKETSFSKNGLAVLNECLECKILEKLNMEFELRISYPLQSTKAKHIQRFNVIKADGQLFRIYNISKDSKAGVIYANARHIFYDLLNYMIEDKTAANKTCQQALDIMIADMGADSIYTVESDISDLKNQSVVKKNGVEAIFLLLNEWQGELIRDNFTIKINTAMGSDNGVQIRYGKNIIGINETIDCDNVVTKIYPVGANGITLPEKHLINAAWQGTDYPSFALLKIVEFSDAETESDLRSGAQTYLDEHSVPEVNYQIDFLKLGETTEYKNYKSLEEVDVGDIVTVKHDVLGIDLKVKVIGIEKDILSAKNTKVELGQPLQTIEAKITELLETSLVNNKLYYGIRINEDVGLEVIRSDRKSRGIINADGFKLQKGDGLGAWNDKFYADSEGNLILDGAISWNNVTDQPNIPETAEDVGAKPYDWLPAYGDITGIKPPTNADNTFGTIGSNRLTYIDGSGIYTGTLTAQQINAIQGIVLGANATIQWADLPSLPTATQVGARPDSWIPSKSDLGGWTTYIDGSGIYTGVVNANQVNAGTLTGFTIKTSGSGYRTEMKQAGAYPDYSFAGFNSSDNYHGLVIIPSVADLVIYENGNEAFRIYMADPVAEVVKLKGYQDDILGYNNFQGKTYPLGTWDFGSCTVLGLTGGSSDHKVICSANDTTPGYLEDKITYNTDRIYKATNNDGANENIYLSIPDLAKLGDIWLGGIPKSHVDYLGNTVTDTSNNFVVTSEFIPWSDDTKLMVQSKHSTQEYTILEVMSPDNGVTSREATVAVHVYDSTSGWDYFGDFSMLTYQDDPRMVMVAQSRGATPPWIGTLISTNYFSGGGATILEGSRFTRTAESIGETHWRRQSNNHINMIRLGDYTSMVERLAAGDPNYASYRRFAIMYNAYCTDYTNNYYQQYSPWVDSYKIEMDGTAVNSSAGGGIKFFARPTLTWGKYQHNDSEWILCASFHKNGMSLGLGDFYLSHGYGTDNLFIGKADKYTKFLGNIDFSTAQSVTGFTAVFG